MSGRQATLPFGEDFGESGTQEKHHFTSYERDAESGTDYALNRQYAESVGRFIRVDPSRGTVTLPQSLNRYAYVTNNPVNAVHPLGLFPIINFPPICPVVNGVAMCGSLGSVNVSAGATGTLLGGGSGVLSDFYVVDESAGESGGGDPGQNIWDLLSEFWNRLNRCEKLVALGQPFGALAANEAELTATDVELNLRGGQTGDDDYPNAVKHCVWSCIMTVKLDLSAAYAFGTAHESDPKNDCNVYTDQHSLMDQHNNEVGRTIGYNLGFSGSAKECIKRCKASSDLQNQL